MLFYVYKMYTDCCVMVRWYLPVFMGSHFEAATKSYYCVCA